MPAVQPYYHYQLISNTVSGTCFTNSSREQGLCYPLLSGTGFSNASDAWIPSQAVASIMTGYENQHHENSHHGLRFIRCAIIRISGLWISVDICRMYLLQHSQVMGACTSLLRSWLHATKIWRLQLWQWSSIFSATGHSGMGAYDMPYGWLTKSKYIFGRVSMPMTNQPSVNQMFGRPEGRKWWSFGTM